MKSANSLIRQYLVLGILTLSISHLPIQEAHAKDFIWRVKSATATVYLLGSVHVLRSADYPLPASFESAFNAAQQVAFEIDPDEAASPSVQSYITSKASYPAGQSIQSALSSSTFQKLQSFAVTHGYPNNAFDGYRPWYVALLVENFSAADAGFQTDLGLDNHYFDAAKAAGKTRIYLETSTFQVDTLAGVPESEYTALLPSQIDTGKEELVEVVDAWRAGNVGRIAQYAEAIRLSSPEQYRLVYQNRNSDFAAKAENLLAQGKVTLFIVGAAHLVGADGVVSLLQARGHEVIQLPGTPPAVGPLMLNYAPISGERIDFASGASPMLVEGASATLALVNSATGDGSLRYQWLKDGQAISGATGGTHVRSSLKRDDAGHYQVRVESDFGTATSAPFEFAVVPVSPPRLAIHPSRFGGVNLILSGTTNAHYRVEYADRLPGPWLTLTNFSLHIKEQGVFLGSSSGARFYRAVAGAAAIAHAAPVIAWARNVGGTNDDEARGIATDESGNVFVSGSLIGAARFGNVEIAGNGTAGRDVFIAKYDGSGSLLWLRTAGGTGEDYGQAVAIDTSGDCYVTGSIGNGGSSIFGTNGFAASNFVAKYDRSGNFEWVVPRGGRAIVADTLGNTYVAGGNPVVEKSDASGKLIFSTASPKGTGHLFGLGIAVDDDRSAYVAGQLSGQIALEGFSLASSGSSDLNMFIAKFANDGNLVWAKSLGGPQAEIAFNVAVDSEKCCFVTGVLSGKSGLGDTSPGTDSMFVAKFDRDGNLVWARQAISRTSAGYGLATDRLGNAYASGIFGGQIAIGTFSLDAQGGIATWVAKFNKNGDASWAIKTGGGGASSSLSIRNNGEGFLSGSFRGTSISFGDERLSSTGLYDAFFMKLTGL